MLTTAIVSPFVGGRIEGALSQRLLNYLPAESIYHCDVVVIPVSRIGNIKIDPELTTRGKPWVLLDFTEYGANEWDRKSTHLFGSNDLDDYSTFDEEFDEWRKFDQWVRDNPPILTLKRELLQKDVSARVMPADYTCYLPEHKRQSREEFYRRPLEVFYSWGHSHEGRRRVHGEIFKQSSHMGYDIISAWDQFNPYFQNPHHASRVWAAIYTPHFTRIDISKIMKCQEQSLLSLSMPGAGVKCFRSAEAPVNSVMVLQDDPLAWAIPWVHGENCIRVPKDQGNRDNIRGLTGDEEVATMNWWLTEEKDRLYDIYLRGLETVDQYRPENYVMDYMIPQIEQAYAEH